MYKYEMHVHTSECDIGAQCRGAEIVNLYRETGYSGIVITDHYLTGFFDGYKSELCTDNHTKIIERYLKGYYSARNEAEKTGFTVFCGAEVRLDSHINDYLVYGLEEKDFYELPFLCSLKSVEELVNTLPDYALVVQAHPFRDNMVVCNPTAFFGIEGYNSGTDKFRNEMAKMYAKHYRKAVTSGSDFHIIEQLGKGGIVTKRKIYTSRDLTKVLKSGDYSLIENE